MVQLSRRGRAYELQVFVRSPRSGSVANVQYAARLEINVMIGNMIAKDVLLLRQNSTGCSRMGLSCKCRQCVRTRYERHDWVGCKFSTHGRTRDAGQVGTVATVQSAGKIRHTGHKSHKWDGRVCEHWVLHAMSWRMPKNFCERRPVGQGMVERQKVPTKIISVQRNVNDTS